MSTIPQGLLCKLTPIEVKVTEAISQGGPRTFQSLADELAITLNELLAIWADVQQKCQAWLQTDLSAAVEFIKYKLDDNGNAVLRTRAERIAMFAENIAKAEATGCRGNDMTAEQFDAVLFPDAPPNPKDVN